VASGYVRLKVKEWLADPASAIPFYNTVNESQNPVDEIWKTVMWMDGYKEKLDYCGETMEVGSFGVMYFGAAGIGDDVIMAAAEDDMRGFMMNIDPTGRLSLRVDNPPDDWMQDNGNNFVLLFNVTYEFY
jgi:hypothetical protein